MRLVGDVNSLLQAIPLPSYPVRDYRARILFSPGINEATEEIISGDISSADPARGKDREKSVATQQAAWLNSVSKEEKRENIFIS